MTKKEKIHLENEINQELELKHYKEQTRQSLFDFIFKTSKINSLIHQYLEWNEQLDFQLLNGLTTDDIKKVLEMNKSLFDFWILKLTSIIEEFKIQSKNKQSNQ